MRLPKRFRTYCLLFVGSSVLIVVLGFWLLLQAFKPKYPDLDVPCFKASYDVFSEQADLRTKIEGSDHLQLSVDNPQDNMPAMTIHSVFGYIHNPVLSPDNTLLLFSEDGPAFHGIAIVRGCNMKTGQQEFYILDLPYMGIATITFSPDGSIFTLYFDGGTEKQYQSATGKELK